MPKLSDGEPVTNAQKTKADALAKHFGMVSGNEIEPFDYDDCLFNVFGKEWLVLTDKEANERARLDIEGLLWAFKPSFVLPRSCLLDADGSLDVLTAIREQCESGNDAMRAIIKDLPAFVRDAIKADGRGYFLSGYDGEEVELKVDGKVKFYAYRVG